MSQFSVNIDGLTPLEGRVFSLVRSLLTPDMVKLEYRQAVDSEYCGHCHHASLAMYYLLGGKSAGYKMRKAVDELGIIHYWLERPDGAIIDPTAEQYTALNRPLPYDNRINKGVSHMISRATKVIMEKAKAKLNLEEKSTFQSNQAV